MKVRCTMELVNEKGEATPGHVMIENCPDIKGQKVLMIETEENGLPFQRFVKADDLKAAFDRCK